MTTLIHLLILIGVVILMPFKSRAATSAIEIHDKNYNLSFSQLAQLQVEIATGSKVPLHRAPAIASVITSADIEKMGARNLFDILERVPGVHVQPSAVSRMDPIFSVRGIHTGLNPQVLLLLDGIPVSSTAGGGARPVNFRFPAANIERIEVIRGPGSAIYGADAYAGVINIIPKSAETYEGFFSGLRVGSFGSEDFWLMSGAKVNDWSTLVNFSYQESDGDEGRVIDSDLQTTLDEGFGTQASLAPDALNTAYEMYDFHAQAENKSWNAFLWYRKSVSQMGAGGVQALDNKGRDTGELYMMSAQYGTSDWLPLWDFTARAAYYYYSSQAYFQLLPPGTVLPIGGDGNLNFINPVGVSMFSDGVIGKPGATLREPQISLVSVFSGLDNHRARFELGAKYQSVHTRETKNFGPGVIVDVPPASDGVFITDGQLTDVSNSPFIFLPSSSREIFYFSFQDEWTLSPKWHAVAGVRYDDYSDFGHTINPRMALVWDASEELTAKCLYGSAFRPPSIGEFGFINNPVSIGNPALEPETIDTWELGIDYHFGEYVQTRLNFYHYLAQGMIEFVPNENSTSSTAQNARDQKGYGIESELIWTPSSILEINATFAWQKSEDKRTGEPIADAPGKQFGLAANWAFNHNWFFYSHINHISDRKRSVGDTRDRVEDYSQVTFRLKKQQLVSRVDASLTIRNAFDEDVREPSNSFIKNDFPMEGRSFWLEVEYKGDL